MDRAILEEEALKLNPLERAQLIDALWESLDAADQPSIDRAWIQESVARLREHRAGRLPALDGAEVLSSIERELRK
jgi:putative addiction module component (TIGR02574 family)